MEKGNAGEMRKRRRCGVVLQEDCPPFQLLLAHRPPPPPPLSRWKTILDTETASDTKGKWMRS